MEGEDSPKIETEAEGVKDVEANVKEAHDQEEVHEESIQESPDAKKKENENQPQEEKEQENQPEEEGKEAEKSEHEDGNNQENPDEKHEENTEEVSPEKSQNEESPEKEGEGAEKHEEVDQQPEENEQEHEETDQPHQETDQPQEETDQPHEEENVPQEETEQNDEGGDQQQIEGSQEQREGSQQPEEYSDRNEVYDRHQIEGPQYERDLEDEYQYNEQDDEETKRLVEEEEDEDERGTDHMDPEQYEEEEEEEEDPMQSKIRAIIELCQQNNGKYGDTDFPPNDASLYKNPAEPPDYAESTPVVEWMRPEEALKSGNEDEIKMISQGLRPGDVKQGTLGDCWLLGAFLVLATHPELLQNLIVKDGIKFGFAVFQFFKNGEWKQVLVDTRLPYTRENKVPLYGHCADPTEVWVPLMEKAYAKLHGCYENLNGGSLVEALVDLTGGVSEKIFLQTEEAKDAMENGQLWKELRKYFQAGYLLGCSNSKIDEAGVQEEGAGNQGIQFNHAYGIMDIRVALGIQLIRIRNPWGYGEWTGRFADEDEAWDDAKGLKEELKYQFEDDGTWWMRYDDWYNNYNRVYVCKVFPPNWQQYSIIRQWEGNTAGGPYPPDVDRDETTGVHTTLDTNDKWFNNPQFRLTVHK